MWNHPKEAMNEGHVLMIPCVSQFSRFVWAITLIVMEKEAYIYTQLFQYIYTINVLQRKKNKERKQAKLRVKGAWMLVAYCNVNEFPILCKILYVRVISSVGVMMYRCLL